MKKFPAKTPTQSLLSKLKVPIQECLDSLLKNKKHQVLKTKLSSELAKIAEIKALDAFVTKLEASLSPEKKSGLSNKMRTNSIRKKINSMTSEYVKIIKQETLNNFSKTLKNMKNITGEKPMQEIWNKINSSLKQLNSILPNANNALDLQKAMTKALTKKFAGKTKDMVDYINILIKNCTTPKNLSSAKFIAVLVISNTEVDKDEKLAETCHKFMP